MNFRSLPTQLLRLVKPDATDENWKFYGEKFAYFGVVNWPQFRPENLNEQTKEEFFQTGEGYIEQLVETIRKTVEPDFHPEKAVDFGCGVGRLVIPLAKRCGEVTGIDVSPGMLAEAKENCAARGVTNVHFEETVDALLPQAGKFDFINSFIVFQHIRPERGYEIFDKLVRLLKEGGIGAVQFTYCDPGGRRARAMHWLYRKIPLLWALKNVREGRPFDEPMADMAEYSVNKLFRILQEAGCDLCHTRFSRHGSLGVLIIFKKETIPAF